MTAAVILTENIQDTPILKSRERSAVHLIKELKLFFNEIILISDQPSIYLPYVKDSARILSPYYKGFEPLSSLHASLSLAVSDEVWLLHESTGFPGIQLFEELRTAKKLLNCQSVILDHSLASFQFGLFDKSVLGILERLLVNNDGRLELFLNQINYTSISDHKIKSL